MTCTEFGGAGRGGGRSVDEGCREGVSLGADGEKMKVKAWGEDS